MASNTTFLLTFGVLAAAAIPLYFFSNSASRRVRRKIYQYEVTFGLYMLTPTEKFVLSALLLSLHVFTTN